MIFGGWWWGLDRNASWFTSEAPRVGHTEELLHYVSQPAHPPGVGVWLREETESTGWISEDVGKRTWFILDLSWFITFGYVPQHGNILLFPSWHIGAWQPQLLLIQSPFSAVNFQFTHGGLGRLLYNWYHTTSCDIQLVLYWGMLIPSDKKKTHPIALISLAWS